VYRQTDSKHVHIKSNDHVKECIAMGCFPSSRNFPTIEYSDRPGYDYTMKYYPKQKSLKTALKPSEWSKYQDLRNIFRGINYQYNSGYKTLHNAFKGIKNRTLRKHMKSALDALANYGEDVCFEISPRNVAVSNTGVLILLDVFFLESQLQKVTEE
jgi:hypothetical protein